MADIFSLIPCLKRWGIRIHGSESKERVLVLRPLPLLCVQLTFFSFSLTRKTSPFPPKKTGVPFRRGILIFSSFLRGFG